jgi:hypothetical protein
MFGLFTIVTMFVLVTVVTLLTMVTLDALATLVGFEVLTAVSTKMAVFWVVATCSLVEVYQRLSP